MSTAEPVTPLESVGEHVRRSAGLMIVLGILSVMLGILAINAPLWTGVAVTLLIGCYLIARGIFDLFAMFRAKGLGCGILAFLSGALSVAAGIVVLFCPVRSLALLTLVLAVYFVLDGIARILLAFKTRPLVGWGWHLFGGIVAVVLGIMVWRQWPLSSVWAIGVLAGIHILFSGWTQIFIGMAARKGVGEIRAALGSA